MILVSEGAETKLQKALIQLRQSKSAARCLKVKTTTSESAALLSAIRHIDDLIDDPDGTIFNCEDDEIFVIAQGMTSKTAERLATLLQSPAELFDPAAHWTPLMEHVETKAARIAARAGAERLAEEKKKKERLCQIILDMPMQKELLLSISKKRGTREKLGIIIVEDDTFTRNLISGALHAQFELSTAGDGYNAVAKYPSRAPDIVFLDIDLPDVSGLDLLKKILELDPDAFVVMLSGNSQRENILKAVERGAKGFIGKPFTKDKLLQYIHKCPRYKHLGTGVPA